MKEMMSTARIIFLDLDGVLHTERYDCFLSLVGSRLTDSYGSLFSPKSLKNLKRIIDNTGAKIVLSSNWRNFGLDKIRQMWKDRQLPGEVIDCTPYLPNDKGIERGREIEQWLCDRMPDGDQNFVILDDRDDFYPYQKNNFIKVSYRYGITLLDVYKAVKILNQ